MCNYIVVSEEGEGEGEGGVGVGVGGGPGGAVMTREISTFSL